MARRFYDLQGDMENVETQENCLSVCTGNMQEMRKCHKCYCGATGGLKEMPTLGLDELLIYRVSVRFLG